MRCAYFTLPVFFLSPTGAVPSWSEPSSEITLDPYSDSSNLKKLEQYKYSKSNHRYFQKITGNSTILTLFCFLIKLISNSFSLLNY
jgi:hypothetical protein